MRVAVLWTALSGYLNACLQELASHKDVELFVAHLAPKADAPFHDSAFAWISNRLIWHSRCELEPLPERLREFDPQVLLIAGWHVREFRKVARAWQHKAWRVIAMDHSWTGTPRQRAAVLVAPYFLRPLADAIWIPGDAQVSFAQTLGFSQGRILRGLYCADCTSFQEVHRARLAMATPVPRSFLFVGRIVREKGIDILLEAYQLYRSTCEAPWPLICCGTGPLQSRLTGIPGLRNYGFVQPAELPEIMAMTGCLVLPSLFEPWGVVLHEAAAAGLLLVSSENVGAAIEFVESGTNGFTFRNCDVCALADRMLCISAMDDAQLQVMSCASHILSRKLSLRGWADTLLWSHRTISAQSDLPEPANRGRVSGKPEGTRFVETLSR